MENKKVTYNGKAWIILAGILIIVLWKVLEILIYGHTVSRLVDNIIFVLWLISLNFAFRMGKGEDVFAGVRAWWGSLPGMSAEEFAAAQAAEKAAAQPTVCDAPYEEAEPAASADAEEEEEKAEVSADTPTLRIHKAKKAKGGRKVVVLHSRKAQDKTAEAEPEAVVDEDPISIPDEELYDMM
jgi:hypothetical protein